MENLRDPISINQPIKDKIKETEELVIRLSQELQVAKVNLVNLRLRLENVNNKWVNESARKICNVLSVSLYDIQSKSRLEELTIYRAVFYNVMVVECHYERLFVISLMNKHRTMMYAYEKNHSNWYGSDKLYTKLYTRVIEEVRA